MYYVYERSVLLSLYTPAMPRVHHQDEFRTALQSSSLCRPDLWMDLDIDGLAQLYDTEVTAILDQLGQ